MLSEGVREERQHHQAEVGSLLLAEDVSWRQKSRTLLLIEGDKNTSFLHLIANAHCRANFERGCCCLLRGSLQEETWVSSLCKALELGQLDRKEAGFQRSCLMKGKLWRSSTHVGVIRIQGWMIPLSFSSKELRNHQERGCSMHEWVLCKREAFVSSLMPFSSRMTLRTHYV